MSDIVRIALLMYPQIPLEAEIPGDLLKAFEANPAFTPSSWGTSERTRQPYSNKAVLSQASDSDPSAIFLNRQAVVRYSGYFDFTRLPFLSFEFHKSFSLGRWPEILELADRIASAVKPRFGVLHIFRPTVEPWVTETDRLVRWMTLAAYPVPVKFRPNGPLGLGMRSYFGHDVMEMFGHDLLLSAPALALALDWGGVRLDLAEDLWNTDQSELAKRWKKVMDYLAPRHAMAEPVFEDDGRTVSFKPSQAWLNRQKLPSAPKAEP